MATLEILNDTGAPQTYVELTPEVCEDLKRQIEKEIGCSAHAFSQYRNQPDLVNLEKAYSTACRLLNAREALMTACESDLNVKESLLHIGRINTDNIQEFQDLLVETYRIFVVASGQVDADRHTLRGLQKDLEVARSKGAI